MTRCWRGPCSREQPPGDDGLYSLKNVWFSAGGLPGPIVVRVSRVGGEGRGLVELVYDSAMSRGNAVVFPLEDTDQDWPSLTLVSGPGCYAYQLDSATFSTQMVFSVEP